MLQDIESGITGAALDEWVTGRVSPEGGEDSGPGGADSPDSMLQLKTKDKVCCRDRKEIYLRLTQLTHVE